MTELEEPLPQEETSTFNQDLMLTYAYRVSTGESGDFMYCLQDGKFYFYEKGVWREIIPIELLDRISNAILDKKGNKALTKFALSQRKNVIENLKLLKYLPLSSFNTLPLINLENYMFDPVGINVLAHKKEYYSTIRIPYRYDEKSQCPLWIKTLDGIFESDKHKSDSLQEFMGCSLTRNTKLEKALLLIGESRSGKSTILNTLQFMIGDANCSHVALANLDNPQYTSMMINKLVNIDGEVNKKAQDFEAQFKTVVTGHEVTCNDKYMPPFPFRPFCKFVMAANEFPKITDHSSAFYNRLIVIPCNRVFLPSEQDRDLREKLLEELPGILNWAIEGLKRLTKRGYFEEKDFMRNALEELEDDNNPVNEFFKEFITPEHGEEIEKGFLYDKYTQWSKKSNNYTLSKAKFSSCVYKRFQKETPKDTNNPDTRKRIWRNLKYSEVDFKSVPNKGWQE